MDDSTLTVISFTVNDGDGGQDYNVTTINAIGTITPATLTITATSQTKVYDGTTSSTVRRLMPACSRPEATR